MGRIPFAFFAASREILFSLLLTRELISALPQWG